MHVRVPAGTAGRKCGRCRSATTSRSWWSGAPSLTTSTRSLRQGGHSSVVITGGGSMWWRACVEGHVSEPAGSAPRHVGKGPTAQQCIAGGGAACVRGHV
eukprot:176279-Chlamydomonas_euryale.AAC.2